VAFVSIRKGSSVAFVSTRVIPNAFTQE
jgi:hypothetical protein